MLQSSKYMSDKSQHQNSNSKYIVIISTIKIQQQIRSINIKARHPNRSLTRLEQKRKEVLQAILKQLTRKNQTQSCKPSTHSYK